MLQAGNVRAMQNEISAKMFSTAAEVILVSAQNWKKKITLLIYLFLFLEESYHEWYLFWPPALKAGNLEMHKGDEPVTPSSE